MGTETALEQAANALDSVWAAIGDALCSGKGIEKEYANAVSREVCEAKASIERELAALKAGGASLKALFIWKCINCGKRVQTHFDCHINFRPICVECNAEMMPQRLSTPAPQVATVEGNGISVAKVALANVLSRRPWLLEARSDPWFGEQIAITDKNHCVICRVPPSGPEQWEVANCIVQAVNEMATISELKRLLRETAENRHNIRWGHDYQSCDSHRNFDNCQDTLCAASRKAVSE